MLQHTPSSYACKWMCLHRWRFRLGVLQLRSPPALLWNERGWAHFSALVLPKKRIYNPELLHKRTFLVKFSHRYFLHVLCCLRSVREHMKHMKDISFSLGFLKDRKRQKGREGDQWREGETTRNRSFQCVIKKKNGVGLKPPEDSDRNMNPTHTHPHYLSVKCTIPVFTFYFNNRLSVDLLFCVKFGCFYSIHLKDWWF